MADTTVGTIQELYRYPVKSLAGEGLTRCTVEAYGVWGDRALAFGDPSKTGGSRYYTAREIPQLLAYRAELSGEDESCDAASAVRVTTPDGRVLGWEEPLLQEIQALTPQPVGLMACTEEGSPPIVVDIESILIVTKESLRTVEALWGKHTDMRRFRPNLVVALDAGAPDEQAWVGKKLIIGGVELDVAMPCERCSLINVDPVTLERDPSLLKLLYQKLNTHFGVYATVRRTGHIQVGDRVILAD
ncbi:MOSC domain-containing protein [Paenibacillus sp. YYML68]|uniref:MOSC domain-containing protein n=1 Tax=Paenibacillus sp. YYML68 TaxID=2909250 RepID=UPI002493ABFC|nr:MOSC domain-containing protein [Paenibacillus sp. YYML68]